jgi:hypothetical protein
MGPALAMSSSPSFANIFGDELPGEWHNYGKSTIGNRSDIERVQIDNLQDF